jgi:predicted nucleotidyltransferase
MEDLLKFLKNNKYTRKIFGERELKIIEKQLQGVSLTQSEKNRLSRDIRKKFEFIKGANRFSEEFELKKGSIIKELIEQKRQEILDSKYFPKIKNIKLFGSTVDNQRTFRSDIDISVEFDEINIKEATEFRIKMSHNRDIDVQVYNILPDKIKKQVNEKGRILYERKNKR